MEELPGLRMKGRWVRFLPVLVGLAVLGTGCLHDPRPERLDRGVEVAVGALNEIKTQETHLTPSELVEAVFDRDWPEVPGVLFLRHPDAPWTVVVSADDETGIVRVQGYGATLEEPRQEIEIEVTD